MLGEVSRPMPPAPRSETCGEQAGATCGEREESLMLGEVSRPMPLTWEGPVTLRPRYIDL
jgi:hypothetical protein